MIQIQNITKSYADKQVLKGLSLNIAQGETLALLGVNGAGKSTLIKILSGLIPFDQGSILLDGVGYKDFFSKAANKARIGIVPQEMALYEPLTAAQNIHFWGSLYGLSAKAIRARMKYYLGMLGLESVQDKKLHTLSIGQQKIISLLCGILHEPEILFLDEPTVGIDILHKEKIYTFIHELKKKDITIIYTTHNFTEIPRICDRVAILKDGVISDLGTEQELIAQYQLHHAVDITLEEPVLQLSSLPAALANVGGLEFFQKTATCLTWVGQGATAALPVIIASLHQAGHKIASINIHQPTLENIFIEAHA